VSEKTPEARLLALIKGESSSRRSPWEGLKAAAGRIKSLTAPKRWRFDVRDVSVRQWLNRGLLLAVLVLAGWAVVAWSLPAAPAAVEKEDAPAAGSGPEDFSIGGPSLKALTQRPLFRHLVAAPPPAPKMAEKPEPPPAPKVPLSERAAHWRLTGILGGDPLQAIMEDKRRGNTRYVSTGDNLDGVRVEKVMPDRVILAADGETLELSL
jgi:hypothetical protein